MTRTTAARLLRTAQLGELRMACTDHVRFAVGEATETEATATSTPAPFPGMVWIPGGTFQMGSGKHYPEERPVHRVSVDGFWIDRYPVTNARFERFIAADEPRDVCRDSARSDATIPARCRTCCTPAHWCS